MFKLFALYFVCFFGIVVRRVEFLCFFKFMWKEINSLVFVEFKYEYKSIFIMNIQGDYFVVI